MLNGQVVLAREVDGAEGSPVRFTDTVLCYRGINQHVSRALLLPEGYGAIVSAEHIDAITDLSTNSVAVRGPL